MSIKSFRMLGSSLAALGVLIGLVFFTLTGHAAAFNANNLMDDAIFNNVNTMSATAINTWISNNFPSSCIMPGKFTAPDPTGYSPSGGFTYGGNASAGQIIADAAQAYGINPQVLLVTLQKEQSLVSGGGGCSTLAYTGAMGYGCPDGGTTYSYSGVNLYTWNGTTVTSVSGTCVNTVAKAGFSEQVVHAAWLLRFGEQRSEGNTGWDVQLTNAPQPGDSWNNSDDPQTCYGGPMTQGTFKRCSTDTPVFYDGYITIDGSSTHMDTGATAALYWYTPHFSGNQHFDSIFTSWFGNVSGPVFQAAYAGESAFPTIVRGNSSVAYFKYQNVGNEPWYDDVSAPQYHTYAVHLATTNPVNVGSPFSAFWPTRNRATGTFAHVYESDGTTLAANQHVAQPGQIIEFDFSFSIAPDTTPGFYPQYFQPVLEGSVFWNMGGVAWLGVTVQPVTFQATYAGQSAYPTISRGQSSAAYFKYQNTGNVPWYDDVSGPQYHTYAVHLATSQPVNNASPFSATWPTNNRATGTFAHVYESDGTTLASDQHVVQPGQIAEFDFTFSVPSNMSPGFYKAYFQPVLEGSIFWNMNGIAWLGVTVN